MLELYKYIIYYLLYKIFSFYVMSLHRLITLPEINELINRALRNQNPPHSVGNGEYIFVLDTGVGKLQRMRIKLIVQVKHDAENGQWIPVNWKKQLHKWWFIKVHEQKSNRIPLANISLASMKYPNKITLVMPLSVEEFKKRQDIVKKAWRSRHRAEEPNGVRCKTGDDNGRMLIGGESP